MDLEVEWRKVLHFIGSETSVENGGLVEGALHQGLTYAAEVARSQQATVQDPAASDGGEPHNASMSWNWLDPT